MIRDIRLRPGDPTLRYTSDTRYQQLPPRHAIETHLFCLPSISHRIFRVLNASSSRSHPPVATAPGYTGGSGGSWRYVRQSFLKWFTTYGVPEEIATDGGPPFNSHAYVLFRKAWDIRKRLSSAYYPQSNGRAEAAVKSAKRILLGNINSATGMLDTDAAAKAIMTHRNTPMQDTGIAPSEMLFGRPIRDHLPRLDRKLRPEWDVIARSREMAHAKRVLKPCKPEGKELKPLNVGDCVQIQNQAGNYPKKWYSTGDSLPNRQYQIVVDGSRRATLRNRKFLRKILPVSRKDVDMTPDLCNDETPLIPVVRKNHVEGQPTSHEMLVPETIPQEQRGVDIQVPTPPPMTEDIQIPTPPPIIQEVRRTARDRVQRKMFSAKLTGKSHDLEGWDG